MKPAETAVEQAFDILQFTAGILTGAAAGFALGILVWGLVRLLARRSEWMLILKKRTRTPFLTLGPILGAWGGMQVAITQYELAGKWLTPAQHVMLILVIFVIGWLCYAATHLLQDIAELRSEGQSSRRLTTQAQMFRRILQVVIAILTLVSIILTFPDARVLMGSILASAGVISLVAGLAAQDSLSNTFAGLQLTFTDAIRVGDYLSVDGMNGTVEEITLTYVVLRVWDDRRIILPSTTFTKNKFENWTRVHTKLLGTVELKLDWRAPVVLIRQEVDRLLAQTDLWDHRTVNVQVTESTEQWMMVRIVVSADNSGNLWDLKCFLREHLIRWLVETAPYSLARVRWQQEEVKEVTHNRSEEEIVRLAQELAALENNEADEPAEQPAEEPAKTAQEARLQASQKRAAKVRRKRIRDRVSELANSEPEPSQAEENPLVVADTLPAGSRETVVLSASDLAELAGLSTPKSGTTSDRLYSGDDEADERSKLTQGPGDQALRQREETTVMRALRDGEIDLDEALARFADYPESQQRILDDHEGKRATHDRITD